MDAIRGAADALGIAEQPRPWLPALPDEVTIETLARTFGADPDAFAYGIEDHPDQQSQKAPSLSPEGRQSIDIAEFCSTPPALTGSCVSP